MRHGAGLEKFSAWENAVHTEFVQEKGSVGVSLLLSVRTLLS
jgi:hypothetical protein